MDIYKIKNGFYKIPDEVREDVSLYEKETERLLKGELSPDRFKPFRVVRGIYAQRGQATYMIRIKVPAGGLTPEQMKRIAELSERFGNGVPHVTSRQDMQIHWVRIEDTPKVMKGLMEVGLTTKGGGGNTVRNITACPDSGVCSREAFDVAPYAIAFTEYFLKHPKALTLPRKYKIAFSGCSDDCSFATVNDVGFIAKKRIVNGREEKGFKVYAAGGMGAYSRTAELLEEFIPAGDALCLAEAVLEVFDKHGNRRNKHKARLRFVMDRLGLEKFKKLYKEEFNRLKKEGKSVLKLNEMPVLRDIKKNNPENNGKIEKSSSFDDWASSNVRPQKQDGFYYAYIRLPIGDIDSKKLKKFADIVSKYGEGSIRTTNSQNMVLRWLIDEELPRFYNALKDIGLANKGDAGAVDDIVCCPGAATCNLGICLSKNMATVITEEFGKSGLDLKKLNGIDIKISGCPNSCGQHPIGAIGLHGAARRGKERIAPHYEILAGGRTGEDIAKLGTQFGFVPAKNIPLFLTDFLKVFSDKREKDEDFYSFLERRGFNDIKNEVERHSALPDYEEDKSYYTDWGADEEFSLAGLGPGECGAGVFDMIETDINDAHKHIKRAKEMLDVSGDPSEDLYKALLLTSKALLVTQGIEPAGDMEAFKGFEEKFVETGLVSEKFGGLQKKGAQFLSGLLDNGGLKNGLAFVEEFNLTVERLYNSMDDSLRFKAEETGKKGKKAEEDAQGKDCDVFMDLRGVKCPINYVKAKIRMEEMEPLETLLLYLDEGEPIQNVPSSLKNDGQEIIRLEKTGEHYELLVKKLV